MAGKKQSTKKTRGNASLKGRAGAPLRKAATKHIAKKKHDDADLRSRAQRHLRKVGAKGPRAVQTDLRQTLHELQVHQIELQMQNEELRRSQTELEVSQRKYSELYDFSPVGGFVMNRNGVVVEANLTGAAMLGFERSRLVGKPFSVFVARGSQDAFSTHRRRVFVENSMDSCEIEIIRKDKSLMHVTLETRRMSEGFAKESLCKTAMTDITGAKVARIERERLNTALNQRTRQLGRLNAELVQAEEKERRRVARILHDDVQQLLVGAKFRIASISRQFKSRGLPESLAEVDRILSESIKASRSLAMELNPPVLQELGLFAAIQWLVEQMRERYGLKVDLMPGTEAGADVVSESAGATLFHIIRELLFNVVKHAKTDRAWVAMEALAGSGEVTIEVGDKGVGTDARKLETFDGDEQGLGVLYIQERVRHMGGEMTLETAAGKGMRVKLKVPAGHRQRTSRSDIAAQRHGPVTARDGKIRVLLVDDHIILREGLAQMLKREKDIDIVAQADSGEMAMDLLEKAQPQVVVMDITMPGMGGIEATRRIVSAMPWVKVVGLSIHSDAAIEQEMKKAGATGYLDKGQASVKLVQAIRNAVGVPV